MTDRAERETAERAVRKSNPYPIARRALARGAQVRRRRTVGVLTTGSMAVVAAAVVAAGLGTLAASSPPSLVGGGKTTPTPIPITINPNAEPVGNTVPTGIVVGGQEMILFFWVGSETRDANLSTDWRDTRTGRITEEAPVQSSDRGLSPVDAGGPIFELDQLDPGDGTVIEYGAVRGHVGRIVVRDPVGTEAEAAFTPWTAHPDVVIFWVKREGSPLPKSPEGPPGVWEPLAPDRYPLVSAYDGKGKLIAEARIRPQGLENKGD